MRAIPKWIWAIAALLVLAMATCLYLLLQASSSLVGGYTSYLVYGVLLTVAIILIRKYAPIWWAVLATPRPPIKWDWVKEWAWFIAKITLLLAILFYGYKNWGAIWSNTSPIVSQISSCLVPAKKPRPPEGWVMSWKAAKGDNARDPNKTDGSYLVTITIHTDERLCFVLHYKDWGRARVAEFFGDRTGDRRQRIYVGTWSQGEEGDRDRDYGTWRLKEYGATSFAGKVLDHRGIEFDSTLEVR